MTDKTEIDQIAERIGFRKAMVLCAIYGGKTLYVPDQASASHRLARDPLLEPPDSCGSRRPRHGGERSDGGAAVAGRHRHRRQA
jgi:hypothetical protein